jgi:uncharacterized membrane-anchored protein YjiN (DUF445 family)
VSPAAPPAAPPAGPPLPTDATRRRDLRRAKGGAAALLLAAAVVFAGTYAAGDGERGVIGFVRAAAEAAMVGGLADWFAVTALFRHPLGLPIPHTALVPRRKDAIGASLGSFVTDHFLAGDVVAARLHDARLADRVGRWLADPRHASRVAVEAAGLLRAGLREARRGDAGRVVARAALGRLATADLAPLTGRALAGLVRERRHVPVIDLIVLSSGHWLERNRPEVLAAIRRVTPGGIPWFVKDPLVERVYARALELAEEVLVDAEHPLRASVDRLVTDYAADLQGGTRARAQFERFLADVADSPRAEVAVRELLDRVLALLSDLAGEQGGAVQTTLADTLIELGGRLRDDAEFAARMEARAERLVRGAVDRYAGEFARLVSDTVARWDAEETTRRIELQIGRDLQFIRVNGTVVGALAGVGIHAVAVLAGG